MGAVQPHIRIQTADFDVAAEIATRRGGFRRWNWNITPEWRKPRCCA
jgi:hypothetical protein